MTINAEPQVRAGSLPTQAPRTIQRSVQAEAPAEAQSAETAPVEGDKPKRKYKPRTKKKIDGDVDLSAAEQAAWGRIALKAMKRGLSVDKYMGEVIAEFAPEIDVYRKLTQLAAPEGAELEPTEGDVAQA